jgi:putative PIN family toxin of toxin-antitoxin system
VRVVLDTNVWVSAVIKPQGHPVQVVTAWRAHRFEVVISAPLLAELRNVLNRPRIRKHYPITDEQVVSLLKQIARQAIHVPVGQPRPLCRDPRDDMVLETAIAGNAAYIVSRDEDITRSPDLAHQLELHGISVITIRRFLQSINSP